MVDELPRVITAASGLISLAIGFYVLLKGGRQLTGFLFFLICACMATWAIGEAMTMASTGLAGKTFWTRFQGIGQMPLIPTYLLLALYFPKPRGMMRERRKAAVVVFLLYSPWLVGLVLLYTTGFFYSSYYLTGNGQGVNVVRTPAFWAITALGFSEIIASTLIYLRESRRSASAAARKGLLILALAPVPMLLANAIQNLELNRYITTPQASIIFVSMLAYGILRYGIFIDIRSVAKNLLVHTMVITANLTVFTALCASYVFGLGLEQRWPLFILFVLTGIPFVLIYHAELAWAKKLTNRYLYGRESEEGRLLQELSRSIRTVSNIDELAKSVVRTVMDSMGLTACALMMSEDGSHRLVGFSAHRGHVASLFTDAVSEGMRMLEWENTFSSDCDSGRFSTYWQVGDRINRGQCNLDFLRLGILRAYLGNGEVRELLWREEIEGEAISIPLEVHGEAVGLLWFGGKSNREHFSMDELDFMVALSTQVAISLLNSRLVQELLDKGARLRTLIQNASTAQEEERIRISRELHDGLAPYFLDLIFRLEMLEADMAGFPEQRESFAELKEKARQGLRDLRRVIGDLRPSSLDVLGLVKSLSTYLERFAAENGLAVQFTTRGDLKALDSLTEVTVFRVAQEALSNIARHAGAGIVRLKLEAADGRVEIMVEDDGVGFIEREVRERIVMGECLGIKGMRERAELLQGDFAIETAPGGGTRITFSFPVLQAQGGGRK